MIEPTARRSGGVHTLIRNFPWPIFAAGGLRQVSRDSFHGSKKFFSSLTLTSRAKEKIFREPAHTLPKTREPARTLPKTRATKKNNMGANSSLTKTSPEKAPPPNSWASTSIHFTVHTGAYISDEVNEFVAGEVIVDAATPLEELEPVIRNKVPHRLNLARAWNSVLLRTAGCGRGLG